MDTSPTNDIVYLDYPLAFSHAITASNINEIDVTAAMTPTYNMATFVPVYETVTTPDVELEFTPHYFLSTAAARSAALIFGGPKRFAGGAIPNMILLNGWPLRFPFGNISTTAAQSGVLTAGAVNQAAGIVRGDRRLTYDGGTSATTQPAAGALIQVDTGANAEVRLIVAVASQAGASPNLTGELTFNYPFLIPHADNASIITVAAPFTHTTREATFPGPMSWNLRMRDSDETTANDFVRKFVGGLVNRATIAADEGGLLRFSFDDVVFLDHVHNQDRTTSLGSAAGEVYKSSRALVRPGAGAGSAVSTANMLGTESVGGALTQSAAALAAADSFPTNEPYYFSQGDVSVGGMVFARIRNFSLTINNNIDTRHYVANWGLLRSPNELIPGRREYAMTATIGLPDSFGATATTNSLWKELMIGGSSTATGFTDLAATTLPGFDITLTFTRGTNDTLTIDIPAPTKSATAAAGLNTQGAIIRRAQHSIGTESPVQMDVDIFFPSMEIAIIDAIAVYP